MDGHFTEQQREALNRAYDILGEHFDHTLIAVASETEHDGQPAETARCFWTGGYMAARGLADEAIDVMRRAAFKNESKP